MESALASTPPETPASRDAALAELVEGYLARLQSGEAIDPGVFAAEHPEHAERLARLLAALELMDDLRRSSPSAGGCLSLTPVLMETPGIAPGLLGDFQIVREIGRGGMGVVYEARQISLNRKVALKILPLAAAMDPRQLQRFQLEAQAAACLHHTNIVPIHAVGCERGVHYYAMQFIEGQTLAAVIGDLRALEGFDEAAQIQANEAMPDLASRLANGDLAPAEPARGISPPFKGGEWGGRQGAANHQDRERPGNSPQSPTITLSSTSTRSRAFFRTAARLGIQAAEAIEHAHGIGVVHRDIKPANLLIDHRGTLWVTDFGLARLQNDSGLTMTGDLMGTLRYMSPEQAMGRPVDLDHRTDIYSLAVTLYELVTLKPAIAGQDRQEVLRKIAEDEPTPPRQHKPTIPRELETILLKAMNKEAGSRYATARELADDLRRLMEDKPIKAKRPTPWECAVKWSRRHWSIVVTASVALTISLILAVVGLGAGLVLIDRERGLARTKEREVSLSARQARERADDLERQLYVNRVNRALGEWRENNVALAESLLDQCPPALRGWEWNYCRGLCRLEDWTIRGHISPIHSLAFGPNGRWIITATINSSGPGEWAIWDTLTTQEVVRRQVSGHCHVAVDRSGSMVAVGWDAAPKAAASVSLWDVTPDWPFRPRGEPDRVLTTKHVAILDLAFSPDGRRIAAATGSAAAGGMELWDARAGRREQTTDFVGRQVHAVAFHPDGNQLAVALSDGAASLHDVTTGKSVGSLLGHAGCVYDVAYSPGGRLLATCGQDKTVRVWEIGNGQTHRILSGHGAAVRAVAFNSDGSRIASASQDNTVRLWDPASGMSLGILRGHGQQVRSLAYSPDGQRIAAGSEDGMVKLWNARVVEPEQTFRHANWVPRAAFFPDGSMVAAADWDNKIRIWDLATGRQRWALGGDLEIAITQGQRQPEIVHSLAMSSDGLRIASTNRSGTVQVWDATTGRLMRTLRGHEDRTLGVAFHPGRHRVASAGWDGTVRVWDADTGDQVRLFRGTGAMAITAIFSPDGSRIASAFADGTVLIWDASNGEVVLRLACEVPAAVRDRGTTCSTNVVAFRSDGRWIAVCSNAGDLSPGEVRVFDVTTGERILTLRGHTSRVVAVAFSPDEARIASASFDRTVKLWELETGQEVCTLRGHTAGVLSVVFSPDGRSLASSSMDGTVKVWNASTAPKRREPLAHRGLSPDMAQTGEKEVSTNQQGKP